MTFLQDVPKCSTIQQQMDPSENFNPLYVTQFFNSYLKAVGGDYVNGSVPITSKVNLSCFYEGRYPSK